MHTHRLHRILLTLCAFIGFTTLATAQNLHMTIGGGFATHYGSEQLVGSYKAGLGVEFELDQHWAIEPALYLYGKGWKNKNQTVLYYDEEGQPLYNEDGTQRSGVKSRTTTANYIELPILAHYYLELSDAHYLVFSAGPYAAIGVSGKQKTKGDAEEEGSRKLYYEEKTFNEKGVHRFDAGVVLGIGYQLPSHFTIGLETDLGLCKFNTAGDKNVSALITLTYQF